MFALGHKVSLFSEFHIDYAGNLKHRFKLNIKEMSKSVSGSYKSEIQF